MPITINRHLIEIQAMSEKEQLEIVKFAKDGLEFAVNNLSHADEISWAVWLEEYRDCTQFPNVQIEAGFTVKKYWDSYTQLFTDRQE